MSPEARHFPNREGASVRRLRQEAEAMAGLFDVPADTQTSPDVLLAKVAELPEVPVEIQSSADNGEEYAS
jgi:hypothetical protein